MAALLRPRSDTSTPRTTPPRSDQLYSTAGAAEIRDGAIEDGMLTLRMDGWLKVLKGITTLEQVIRETGAQ